ncbi:MAG TPA: phospholipase, partial [Flavobacterium sp.]
MSTKYKLAFLFTFSSLFGFSQSETTGKINTVIMAKYELGYVLHKPANTKEKKPLIVFISGDGEKGTDLEKV